MFQGKKIVLGVSGAISAYKSLELARLLVKNGAEVTPVMTGNARKFVTPMSLSALCTHPAVTDMFAEGEAGRISHIDLAQDSDLVVVCPATANVLGKVAGGIADDLLTTLIMASTAPVLFAPSMNCVMWENQAVQENVGKLANAGYLFVGPDSGELACGYEGKGRLAPVEDIVDAADEALRAKDLRGEKVLVTAGPTREPIDPVRFVSNPSSGRMGYAIARAAKKRGAEVVLISGPSHLPVPRGVNFVRVTTAAQMYDECVSYFPQSTVVIMAAAVADYRPVEISPTKVKKDVGAMDVKMERTRDVLKYMGSERKTQLLVGFALETDDLEENARKKLSEKNLDLVVANTPGALDSLTNQVTIINRDGEAEVLPPMEKDLIAHRIVDDVVGIRSGPKK